jgi:hypothetical protein
METAHLLDSRLLAIEAVCNDDEGKLRVGPPYLSKESFALS